MINDILAQRLKEKRKAKNLTQEEVAKKLKINRVAYTLYESGKNTPTVENLKKLADLYETSTDYLLGRY